MEVNVYRRGMGEIFQRFTLGEVQEQNGQQNKGKKNPSRGEGGLCVPRPLQEGGRAASCNAAE